MTLNKLKAEIFSLPALYPGGN